MSNTGIKPATGQKAEALDQLIRACCEMIQVATLEKSGTRDGDGFWHGSDVMDSLMGAIQTAYNSWRAPGLSEAESLKAGKLAHYADRDPKRFVQLDGWTDADECSGRDAEGYGITGMLTTELMRASDVRVLIPLGADPADTVVLLRRAIAWIENGAIEQISNHEEPPTPAISEWSIPF